MLYRGKNVLIRVRVLAWTLAHMGHLGKNIEGQNNTRLMFPMEREQMADRETAVASNWGYDVKEKQLNLRLLLALWGPDKKDEVEILRARPTDICMKLHESWLTTLWASDQIVLSESIIIRGRCVKRERWPGHTQCLIKLDLEDKTCLYEPVVETEAWLDHNVRIKPGGRCCLWLAWLISLDPWEWSDLTQVPLLLTSKADQYTWAANHYRTFDKARQKD